MNTVRMCHGNLHTDTHTHAHNCKVVYAVLTKHFLFHFTWSRSQPQLSRVYLSQLSPSHSPSLSIFVKVATGRETINTNYSYKQRI